MKFKNILNIFRKKTEPMPMYTIHPEMKHLLDFDGALDEEFTKELFIRQLISNTATEQEYIRYDATKEVDFFPSEVTHAVFSKGVEKANLIINNIDFMEDLNIDK